MMKIELKDYRCAGNGCRDKALCYRFRPGKGETAPLTSMYVRREVGQNRCDQFIDGQTGGDADASPGVAAPSCASNERLNQTGG